MGGSEKTVKNKIDTNCYKSEYIYILYKQLGGGYLLLRSGDHCY